MLLSEFVIWIREEAITRNFKVLCFIVIRLVNVIHGNQKQHKKN